MKIPATLKPESLIVIPDTREQLVYLPHELAPCQVAEAETLDYGDYTYEGGYTTTRIERKSLSDLLGCIGRERLRFEKEICGLLGYQHRLLLIESSWQEIERGEWRSQVKPAAVVGSLLKWQAMGLPVLLAGDRERAAKYAARWLFIVARDSYRSSRQLLASVFPEEAEAVA